MSTRSFGEPEERMTAALESQTAKLPSSTYLTAAVTAMGVSALLKVFGKNSWALFVAMRGL